MILSIQPISRGGWLHLFIKETGETFFIRVQHFDTITRLSNRRHVKHILGFNQPADYI